MLKYGSTISKYRIDFLLSIIIAIFILSYTSFLFFSIASNADRGLDITDDAFYSLLLIQDNRQSLSFTDFHHYMSFFGEAIDQLRISGVMMLTGLTILFSATALRLVSELSSPPSTSEAVTVIAATAAGSLAHYFRFWLVTPSYNLACLLGALLVTSGVFLIAGQRDDRRPSRIIAAISLIGCGGFVLLLGRPTSALAIGVLTAICLIVLVGFRTAAVLGSASSALSIALLLCHTIYIYGGPIAYFDQLAEVFHVMQALDAGHGFGVLLQNTIEATGTIVGRVIERPLLDVLPGTLAAAGLYLGLSLALPVLRTERHLAVAGIALFGVGYVIWFWIARYGSTMPLFLALPIVDAILLLVSVAVLAFLIVTFGSQWLPYKATPSRTGDGSRSLHVLPIYLVATALLLSFGTNIRMIGAMSNGYVFLVVAFYLVLRTMTNGRSKALIGCGLLIVVLPVAMAGVVSYNNPYRLPASIAEQTERISFLGRDASLFVDAQTAEWVGSLQDYATRGGWTPGSPLIDMTGATPGAALVLGAQAPVTPWLIGGYEGSADFATAVLARAPRETLQTAWILTAANGVRALPTELLHDIGIDFPVDYVAVGTVRTGHRHEEQVLWRPRHTNPANPDR